MKYLFQALLTGGLFFTLSCNPILPPTEGRHEVISGGELVEQQARFRDVAACEQRFARQQWGDSTQYDTLTPPAFVKLHGSSYGEFVRGDTVFVNAGATRPYYVAMSRHGIVHILQQRDARLQSGGMHWAPPFDFCSIPRALYG